VIFVKRQRERDPDSIVPSCTMSGPTALPICWQKKFVAGSIQKMRQASRAGSYTRSVVPYQLPAIGMIRAPGRRSRRRGTGDHPHVLDRATLQDPPEVNRALALVTRAVGRMRDDVGLPVADELPIESEFLDAIGGGRAGVEYGEKRRSVGHSVHISEGE
jgi:hypothetical protein